jgi:hypothetical protein
VQRWSHLRPRATFIGVPRNVLRSFAMTRDWQDRHAYDDFDEFDVSSLAWECLRRNTRYRKEYPLMDRGHASPSSWGLRFPG